jgi:Na+/H+ antiporter NhaD/arsenite permease-like protein
VLLFALFVLGYLAVVFEHPLRLNKAASALLMGVACWTAYIVAGDQHGINEQLSHHMGELSQILFFLLGAMAIVELIDAHDGFEIITARIQTRSRRKLLVLIALLSFGLSAVLDNLTTSIVMMSLIRKLVPDESDRMYYGGIVIIAANSGGAWSPIGDVTTTMLWIGEQITAGSVVSKVILPSLVSVVVPVLWVGLRMRGEITRRGLRENGPIVASATSPTSGLTSFTLPDDAAAIGRSLSQINLRTHTGATVVTVARGGVTTRVSPGEMLRAGDMLELSGTTETVALALNLLINGLVPMRTSLLERRVVFAGGVGALLFVPMFKTITHLPPFMGILLGLGLLWTLTEVIHKKKTDEGKGALSVASALQRVDAQSILFFLGILLAITALQSEGILAAFARRLDETISDVNLITLAIGLTSAVVDNVPLVAAAQGMYPLSKFPTDHHFWLFLCYCAGTGGSILIIGSAAGVAVMGIQRITFGWYVRHLSLPALLGYAAGAVTYLAMTASFDRGH